MGLTLRDTVEADPGWILLEADLSQAEARIVALLANDTYLLDLFKQKKDVHRITANWFIGKKILEDITEDERFLGKTGRHSGNYDVQKRRFSQTVNSDARKFGIKSGKDILRISEYRGGVILDAFHKNSPKVRDVFHEEVKKAITDTRMLINAFGRQRIFMDRMEAGIYREGYAQIPQSTVGDKLKSAGLEIKRQLPKIRILLESHDALLFTVRRDLAAFEDAAYVIRQEFEHPIDFSRCTIKRGLLSIPCDIKIGTTYKNLVKPEKFEW